MSAKQSEQPTAADPGRDDVPALPPIPGPSAAQRTVASYERPDVRRVISALRNC